MVQANGTVAGEPAKLIEQQFEAIKANLKKWIDRIAIKPSGEPSRVRQLAGKTRAAIKAHPIAAVAVALASG
ncbi:MAG: hypothetical protein ACM31C_01470, partial [Acidobacteriota bacterium]